MLMRQLVDEARRQDRLPATEDHAVGNEADRAFLAGARDADIGKPAFFLQALHAAFIERAAGREDLFLPARQEDHRPFKALGGV